MSRLIDLELRAQTIWLSCQWDAQIIATIKAIPGREYDKRTKRWSVPLAEVAIVMELLEPLHFRFTPRMRDWWAEHRDNLPEARRSEVLTVDPEDGYTVSRLNEEARRAVTEHFGGEVWLVAEVDGFDRNKPKGHAYFELVERASNGTPIATVTAVMFASTRSRVVNELPDDLGFRDGARLRLRGKTELYAPKGSFQFVVEGVDVDWSVGARRRKRDEVLERLTREQIVRRNLELPLPLLPLRIGLITAPNSDAYNDFVHELERTGRGFDLTFHAAKMQGRDADASILRALRWFATRADEFDAIVITRGGGSKGDLGAFDSYPIARAVCELPVKVLVGIGHHRDRSVLDFVAASEKTPTAVAQALAAAIDRVHKRVEDAASRTVDVARRTIDDRRRRIDRATSDAARHATRQLNRTRRRVDHAAGGCERAVRTRLADAQRRVDLAGMRVAERGEARLGRARSRTERAADAVELAATRVIAAGRLQLEHIEAKLRLADPRRVVERGYALVRDADGRVVADAHTLLELDDARLEMRDGTVKVVPQELTDE